MVPRLLLSVAKRSMRGGFADYLADMLDIFWVAVKEHKSRYHNAYIPIVTVLVSGLGRMV